MKEFASEIYAAVEAEHLTEPFDAAAVKETCPGWAETTYRSFLSNHVADNQGGHAVLFVRVAPGLYRTLRSPTGAFGGEGW